MEFQLSFRKRYSTAREFQDFLLDPRTHLVEEFIFPKTLDPVEVQQIPIIYLRKNQLVEN